MSITASTVEQAAAAEVWAALGGPPGLLDHVRVEGRPGTLPSFYDVEALAVASVAVANLAVAEVLAARSGAAVPAVVVDRVGVAAAFRAEALFAPSWEAPPAWDPLAGDYAGADGWVRLHTNYAHHRDAALRVLAGGLPADRDELAAVVARRPVEQVEHDVVAAGGCAAALRTEDRWTAHPQGRSVAAEPIVAWDAVTGEPGAGLRGSGTAVGAVPLAGVRVLDLTRVIAGPVATGFLAAHGADVIRLDPVGFDEVPALVPVTTGGKRCCRLDLRLEPDRARFEELVAGADLLVTGLRPGALGRLGYATERLRVLNGGLAVVRLDAYGWTGPWAGRRGFDSLVQMSTGIAAVVPEPDGRPGRPRPLPAQALDHATGYLAAAAAARALTRRLGGTGVAGARLSLARTARLLAGLGGGRRPEPAGRALTAGEIAGALEPVATAWGPARRVRWPGEIAGAPVLRGEPAAPLGSAVPQWERT